MVSKMITINKILIDNFRGFEKETEILVGDTKLVLLDAPNGERVIIVMGAVNVMKPRVSGTLNKYILCIA